MNTPVLFIVFNQVDTALRVMKEIRRARPPQLFIAADAPRPGNDQDRRNCPAVKELVSALVDWPCTVKTLYFQKNLGPRIAIAKAITWFFSNVERGIILEADCLPHPTFFAFCEELLTRYKNDRKIMHINGNNFQKGVVRGDGASYYFSAYPHIWGWATWRRAWKKYDLAMKEYPAFVAQKKIRQIFPYSAIARFFWLTVFSRFYKKQAVSTWDYQWTFALWNNGGIVITPNKNLVSNIGFGPEAIHSKNPKSKFANIPARSLGALRHPKQQIVDAAADAYTFRNNFAPDFWRFTVLFPLRMLRQTAGQRNKK